MTFYKKIITALLILFIAVACGEDKIPFNKRIPEVEKSQFIKHPDDWRNLRYAEIVPVFRKGAKFYVEVYNTIGSNELPQELWEKLDADEMTKEYGAQKVILNGPRYWVINQLDAEGETASGKVANFGGIEMTLRATIESNIFEGSVGSKLYEENEVNRETTYHFWKGNMVYELISPKGDVYRMQSYALMKDPTLTIDKLENLGDRLSLPEGWSYRTRVLEENSTMTAAGTAYVINDDLGNSYQKILN